MGLTVNKTWGTNEDLTSTDFNSVLTTMAASGGAVAGTETVSGRWSFTGGIVLNELVATDAAAAGDIKLAEFRWDPVSGTATDADGFYISWMADDDGGTETEMGRQHLELDDTGAASEDSSWHFHVQIAGTLTDVLKVGNTIDVGADDTGYDVNFYGATAGKKAWWDESEDTFQLQDSTNLTFGTGADADIYYDGTDLNISPAVVGSGDLVINGASIEFADSEGVTLGTGKDATIQYDGTDLVISPAAVGTGDVVISGGRIEVDDSEGVAFGTGNDALINYDGTDLVISPAVVGTGDVHVSGGRLEVDDNEGIVFGTGKDAKISYDGTNLVITPADVGSGDVTISGGNLIIGNTTYDSNTITQATGAALNIALSAAAGDDFTVDTDKFVVEGDDGGIGIGTATPLNSVHVKAEGLILRLEDATDGFLGFIGAADTTGQGGAAGELGIRSDTAIRIGISGGSSIVVGSSSNVGINTTSFGASASGVLALKNGTQGGAAANMVQLVSEDLSAGNTILSLRTEGSGVVATGTPAAADGAIAVKVNGTVRYLTYSDTAPT